MAGSEMMQKIEGFENAGWKYLLDGQDWSSGSWFHNDLGSVNKGGGSFSWIGEAVVSLEKFLKNVEFIKQS